MSICKGNPTIQKITFGALVLEDHFLVCWKLYFHIFGQHFLSTICEGNQTKKYKNTFA